MESFKTVVIVVSALVAGNSLGSVGGGANSCRYDLRSPNAIYTLPAALREISALTYVNPMTLVCIEDEHGILYTYNLETRVIAAQRTFGAIGDYEGIARIGETMYVLRSDGWLFEVAGYSSESPAVKLYPTGISSKDNEGLCYDASRHRLLIAAKSKSGKGAEFKNKRLIHEFNLKTMSMQEEPAFILHLPEITQFMRTQGIALPQSQKVNDGATLSSPVVDLKPSAIAIHPITGELYLLSSSSHLLVVFNMEGRVQDVKLLDPELFNQAEGMTFNEKSDLFISNEGGDKAATILLFKFHKN